MRDAGEQVRQFKALAKRRREIRQLREEMRRDVEEMRKRIYGGTSPQKKDGWLKDRGPWWVLALPVATVAVVLLVIWAGLTMGAK